MRSEHEAHGAGQRLAAVGTGCVLAAGAAVVARFDPSRPASPFPACAFRHWTGWWCPGCGLTRGAHHLLNGRVADAIGSNLFTPVVLVAVVVAWWAWCRRAFGLRPSRLVHAIGVRRVQLPPRWVPALQVVVVVTVAVYGVLRNLALPGSAALAP